MLEIGLLWADDVKHDLPGSVTRAAKRYEERTGSKPNVAYVNQEQWRECTCVFMGEEAE